MAARATLNMLEFVQETMFYWILTGEILRLTHVARGLDSEGVLLIDIVINGFVPPSLSSSHLGLQVCLWKWLCVSKGPQLYLEFLLRQSAEMDPFDLCDLIWPSSHRTLMSHTCRRAKDSCTHGHRRPTREQAVPWCCDVITPSFTRGRTNAKALYFSCSRFLE